MNFPANNQTEQFWHPVMGAVDLITGQVIESRRAKRQERLRTQMMGEQRQLDEERYGREVKGKQFSGMMDIYKSMLGDKDIEQSEKTKLLKGMTDLVNAGPESTMTAPQAPAQMARPLREDVAKAFSSVIPAGKQLPYEMALKIEQQYDTQRANMMNAESRKITATRGPKNLQDKTLQELLAMRRAYAPRMMKMSDEYGNETVEEIGGDLDVLAEIDARIAELQGFEGKQPPPPGPAKPAPFDSTRTMSGTVNQAVGTLAAKGNPNAQQTMSGISEPSQGMDASMKALIDEMKQIRKEAQKLK